MCGIRLWYTSRRCANRIPWSAFLRSQSGAMSEVDTRDDIPIRTGFLAVRYFGILMFCQFMESLWHSSIR